MLEFRDLVRIEAIAAEGGVGKAARALGMTQPALTRAVTAIEALLRAPLFRRSRRGMEPTDLCRTILADASDILVRMRALHERIGAVRGGSGEELVVAAGPFPFETTCVAAAVAFARAMPRVRLRLDILPWPAALAALRAGTADLAVITGHEVSDGAEFAIDSLPSQPLLLVVRSGHPLTRRARPTLAEALRFPLVTTAHLSTRMHAALAEIRAASAGRHPDMAFPAMLMEPMGAWVRVVRASDAVAIVTHAPVEEAVAAGQLVVLPVGAPWLATSHVVLRNWRRARSEASDAYLLALREAAGASAAVRP